MNHARPIRLRQAARARALGFSLIEIALAIAVIAFAFVGLLGLLPAGLQTFRRALDLSICTQIAQRVVSEAQSTEFDLLTDQENMTDAVKRNADPTKQFSFRAPLIQKPGVRFFDDQGNEIQRLKSDGQAEVIQEYKELNSAEKLRVVYHVNTRIAVQVAPPYGNETNNVFVPPSRTKGGYFPVNGSSALITVQVAHNPGGVPLQLSKDNESDPKKPMRNLWLPREGVDVFTYTAYVGRNK